VHPPALAIRCVGQMFRSCSPRQGANVDFTADETTGYKKERPFCRASVARWIALSLYYCFFSECQVVTALEWELPRRNVLRKYGARNNAVNAVGRVMSLIIGSWLQVI
jgi:hypothetical protein